MKPLASAVSCEMRALGVVGAIRRMRFRPVRLRELCVAHVFIRRQIEDQQSIDARGFRVAMEQLETVAVDRVQVGVEDDGHLGGAADFAHAIEHAMHRRASRQGAGSGELIDHAIGEGIGKRHAKFQDVHASRFKRDGQFAGRREVRVSGGNVGDEGAVPDSTQGGELFVDSIRHFRGARILRMPRWIDSRFSGARVRARMSAKPPTLTVNEIYESIQGESTWAGLRCVFVRLTFCDLRCTYCDTAYAFYKGDKQPASEVLDKVLAFDCPLVEITGGEPLLQKNVLPLMTALCDAGRTVLIETSGAHDISAIDSRVHRIMDLKTPGSGECARNLVSNIAHLTPRDEVKCVIGSREDYEWSREQVRAHDLTTKCGTVLFSPIFGRIEAREIVEWIVADHLPVRFQLQMHKFIWDPKQQGV